jgi:hypothetical protein
LLLCEESVSATVTYKNRRSLIHIQAFWPLNYRREITVAATSKAHGQRELTAKADSLSTAIRRPIVTTWEWGVL